MIPINQLCYPELVSIPCNVDNCAECLEPNLCYICDEGYMKIQSSSTQCWKSIDLFPNCMYLQTNYQSFIP